MIANLYQEPGLGRHSRLLLATNASNLLICLASLLTFPQFISANDANISLDLTAAQGTTVHKVVTNSCSFYCPHTFRPSTHLLLHPPPLHFTTTLTGCLLKYYLYHSVAEMLYGSWLPQHGRHHQPLPPFSASHGYAPSSSAEVLSDFECIPSLCFTSVILSLPLLPFHAPSLCTVLVTHLYCLS